MFDFHIESSFYDIRNVFVKSVHFRFFFLPYQIIFLTFFIHRFEFLSIFGIVIGLPFTYSLQLSRLLSCIYQK